MISLLLMLDVTVRPVEFVTLAVATGRDEEESEAVGTMMVIGDVAVPWRTLEVRYEYPLGAGPST